MKNNILNRFAFNDLRTHKKDSMSLLIMIFIASLIIFTISFISQTYSKEKYDEYQYKYGTYTYSFVSFDNNIEGTSVEMYNEFIPLSSLEYCVLENYGTDFNGIRLFNFNGNPDVVGIHLKEGRFPENENEIVLNERYLEEYDFDYTIGDVINLIYKKDFEFFYKEKREIFECQVKVVGFIEGTSDYPVVVNMDEPINYHLYFATPHNAKVTDNKSTTTDVHMNFIRNNKVDQLYSISSIAYKLGIVEVLTFVIIMTLIYSLSIISFEKKQRDYTLLRSIGITQKQLYYIVFIQTLMLSVFPILFSSIIHYLFSMIMHVGTSLDIYLWNIFKILAIVFVGYFIPAHSITRQSLIGSFEEPEFRHFYYQYKKLHTMRPFYLGYRQLIASKKQALLKIVLIALVCMQIPDITSTLLGEKNKIVKTTNRYNVAYYIKDDNMAHKDKWEFMNEYVSDIHFLKYMETPGNYRYPIYCDSEDVRDYYQYQIIPQAGECLINGYRLISFKDNFDDEFVFDETTDYIVLNKADYERYYERYKRYGEYHNVIFTFDSIQQRNAMFKNVSYKLNDIFEKHSIYVDHHNYDVLNKEYILNYTDHISNINFTYLPNHFMELSKVEENNDKPYILTMSLIIVYIFLSSLDTLHHKEDIGTYQLMGMIFKEIKAIYIYKSLLIGIIGLVFGSGCYLLKYYEYVRYQTIYQYLVIPPIITIIALIIIIYLSLLPINFVLKREAFDNKLTRD